MQLLRHAAASFEGGFVRDHFTMIAAPVQCDIDGISKRSHHARLQPTASTSQSRKRALTCATRSSAAATADALKSERTTAAAAKAAGIATPLLNVGLQLYTKTVELGHARHDMGSEPSSLRSLF
jgi:3-hydroxyisobutyrate dehydrogenase-like beta-hydroxyacid dehydrogenase